VALAFFEDTILHNIVSKVYNKVYNKKYILIKIIIIICYIAKNNSKKYKIKRENYG